MFDLIFNLILKAFLGVVVTVVLMLSVMGCTTIKKNSTAGTFLIKGTLSDFQGNPLENGDIILKQGPNFRDVVSVKTRHDGSFELKAPKGKYVAMFACKNYKEEFLEFWYWNIPSNVDHDLQIKIGGLELYGIKAWKTYSGAIVFFRPMSLKKFRTLGDPPKNKPVLIAPTLVPKNILTRLNGKDVQLLRLDKVKEQIGSGSSYMDAYLMHIETPNYNPKKINSICIEIFDSQTGERGQGCAPLDRNHG